MFWLLYIVLPFHGELKFLKMSKIKVTGNENVKIVFRELAHIIVKGGSIYIQARPKWNVSL